MFTVTAQWWDNLLRYSNRAVPSTSYSRVNAPISETMFRLVHLLEKVGPGTRIRMGATLTSMGISVINFDDNDSVYLKYGNADKDTVVDNIAKRVNNFSLNKNH